MPEPFLPPTLEETAESAWWERLEIAWLARRSGEEPPRWHLFLPQPGQPCHPERVFYLVQLDVEFRVKLGLPALLGENYFEHPRLQADDARLDDARQAELVRWEYQLRWKNGDRVRRADYLAAFPQHAALRDLKPHWNCPRCHHQAIALEDETAEALRCPRCRADFTAAEIFRPRGQGTGPAAETLLEGLDPRNYELLDQLGTGGMGEVYRGRDPGLGRDLAVKVMRPSLAGDGPSVRRFVREARVTGALQHPGIVPIHNLGRLPDGRLYFTMKLVRGRTLQDMLADGNAAGPERLPSLLGIFESVCQAVAYAHSKRVIHRDLKPANVMVGRFGEVQVMDWGLAKVLPSRDGAAGPTPGAGGETAVNTGEPTGPADLSQAGAALGTPAFMPPEQAAGRLNLVDERADVFALGAILCVLLTGRPPYVHANWEEVLLLALRGDLAEALGRLDRCGADAELVALCKACLTPDREGRPRDAGAVAARAAAYQAGVRQRLRQAELGQAQAQVKAQEERKRRRLAVGLAVAVVGLVVGGGAVGLWYVRDQARREADSALRRAYVQREVSGALDEAERWRQELRGRLHDERQAAQLAGDPREWGRLLESAQEAHRRAEVLAAGGREVLAPELGDRLASLTAQLEADERDRQLALEVDRIRLESNRVERHQVRIEPAAPKLARAFRDAGYPVEEDSPAEAAARIRRSPIRLPLVAGLDFWALATDDRRLRAQLLEVARGADPDPWRDRFRQADVWEDRDRLQALAGQVDCTRQSPQLLAALGHCFRSAGGDALPLFRRALVHHPGDFWLHYELGLSARDPAEQAGAFRAALALRPDVAAVYYNLGVILQAGRQLDEAAACYRKALELDSNYSGAHNNLGMVLDEQNKPVEALACYRRAVEIDPGSATHLLNLGAALQGQGKLDEAVTCCRKALDIDPGSGAAHNNLGAALRAQGKLNEAVGCFRRAVEVGPDNALAWCNLGLVLRQQGKLAEALLALRRGHELGSRQGDWGYPSADWLLEAERSLGLEGKFAAVVRGEVPPRDAREQLALAEFSVARRRCFAVAARLYATAFATEPDLADDLPAGHRTNAARAAARVSSGQGEDARSRPDRELTMFRRWALGWLRADLEGLAKRFHANLPGARQMVLDRLADWRREPDLASVRDLKSIAGLPQDERASWQGLWCDAVRLEAQARGNSRRPGTH